MSYYQGQPACTQETTPVAIRPAGNWTDFHRLPHCELAAYKNEPQIALNQNTCDSTPHTAHPNIKTVSGHTAYNKRTLSKTLANTVTTTDLA